MEERQVTVDGQTYELDPQFFVIATQNPADRAGAYPLPESQLDRFLISIELGYPDSETEKSLLRRTQAARAETLLEPVCSTEDLAIWQQEVQSLHVSDAMADYTYALLQATRDREKQQNDCRGLSPRAGINLINLSRAHAYLQARAMVLPDDVQSVFIAAAAHRLKGSVGKGTPIAKEILEQVPLNY